MENISRSDKARQLHHSGCNCCQSVLLAYLDKINLPEQQALDLAAPFGRGLSGLREVCGCVSAMAMLAGLTHNAAQTKMLAETFRQENGDINCGRLLQMGKRPCNDLVASAAAIVEEKLAL